MVKTSGPGRTSSSTKCSAEFVKQCALKHEELQQKLPVLQLAHQDGANGSVRWTLKQIAAPPAQYAISQDQYNAVILAIAPLQQSQRSRAGSLIASVIALDSIRCWLWLRRVVDGKISRARVR